MYANNTVITGNLGADAQIRIFPSGDGVASFSIANTVSYKDKSGAHQSKTTWVPCKIFGSAARINKMQTMLLKGVQVAVLDSSLEEESWQKDGKTISRLVLKVTNIVKVDVDRNAALAPAYADGNDHSDFDHFDFN